MATSNHLAGACFGLLCLFSGGTVAACSQTATQGNDRQANSLLQQGRVQEAGTMLQQILASQPKNAVAHQLLCRVYYAQEMADPAVQECEAAVANAPEDSNSYLWLGRAYGYKASHVNPFAALGLAKKVHSSFEQAVALDPSNIAAMDDLGEYYVQAPSIVGGGLDKAEALAQKMLPGYPARAHRLRGLIAEKRKNMATAETEFKSAVAAAKIPESYIDLGHFYHRQNQSDKILPALQAGINADAKKDSSLVDAASILTSSNLAPELSETLLREYLTSPAKSDSAPAFKVHLQLGNLLNQHGDAAGARREYAAALSLAPNYAPAQKAEQGS